ncbi:hypothetical protein Cni_G23605 [Canna indica]|uniref:DUF3741 domain-containing protein n=1 Tax=Canna indica TaxID=4628 RepID=A0AAQ3KUB1_9LILI|nr:hypothetical protein Cni_G23605 [Canna indica]
MKTPPRHSPSFDLHSDSAGCLSGALRRLLCASLRSAAPRGASELADGARWNAAQKNGSSGSKPPATPCIVARLMGLESMPVFPYTPPESVRRSRSTNSADSWPGFLCSERGESVQARRASSSFREAPTYLRQENEDFFVLSFAPEEKRAERMVASGRRGKANVEELKESNGVKERRAAEKKSSQKENVPQRRQSDNKTSVAASPNKEVSRKSCRIMKVEDDVKPPKQKHFPVKQEKAMTANKKKVAASQRRNEAGCSSQATSPVSVLDYPFVDGEYSISFKTSPNSGNVEENRRQQQQQSSRRKLSSKFENLSSNSSSPHQERICRDRAVSLLDEPGIKKSSNVEQFDLNWSQTWGKICMLTEQDVKNSTRENWRSEDVSEIAAVIALEMLELVLQDEVLEITNCAIKSKL